MRGEPHFYDRAGEPISFWRFLWLWRSWRVAWDEVLVRGKPCQISTVWLGLSRNPFTGHPPLIFETLVIGGDFELDGKQALYATEEQALAGHDEMRLWVAALGRRQDDGETA